jgi:hypothetical protein
MSLPRRTAAPLGVGSAIAIALLGAGIAAAQTPPSYIQNNIGLQGFLDGEGVRLRSTEERGIRLGQIVLWPSFFLEGRWDSNLFQVEEEAEPRSVPVIRLVPGLALTNLNPTTFSYEFGTEVDVRIYASGDETLQDQTNAGVKADARFTILPKGAVSITLQDSFRRTLSAQNTETRSTYNRNTNRVGARVDVKPGGGALVFIAAYDFVFNAFDDFDRGEYMSHDIVFRTAWRFYPKTEAFIDASLSIWNWKTDPEFQSVFEDNMPLRVVAGLNGFLTKKLALLAKVGYGNSFHDNGPSYENAIGQAELAYTFSPALLLAAGFVRDFSPSYYGNFFVENRTYLRSQLRFMRQFAIDLSAAYHYVEFAEFDPIAADPSSANDGTYTVVSHKERQDHQVSAHLRFNVELTRWLGLSLGYEFRGVFTDFKLTSRAANTGDFDYIDAGAYVRHQVYGSLNVVY